MKSYYTKIAGALGALSLTIIISGPASAQKLTAEDLVAKHRDSIGAKVKLDAIKSRMVVGTSEFEAKLPSKKTNGKALIASRGEDFMFLVSLNSQEYPFEKIGFFGNRVNLPWVMTIGRSPLGGFIAEHEKMLSTGVFTGAIAGTWALLDPELKGARTKVAGKRKVDDREAYVLEYWPKGTSSGEFTILMFFDTETFRHLRTEYRHTFDPSQIMSGIMGRQQGPLGHSLIESFGDFKTVDGLTLPYSYNAHYTSQGNDGTLEFFWRLALQQYVMNPNLDSNFFTFDKQS